MIWETLSDFDDTWLPQSAEAARAELGRKLPVWIPDYIPIVLAAKIPTPAEIKLFPLYNKFQRGAGGTLELPPTLPSRM